MFAVNVICLYSSPLTPLNVQHTTRRLKDVLFIGNPMYSEVSSKEEARIEILRHLPKLKKIDGAFVTPSDLEAAQQVQEEE